MSCARAEFEAWVKLGGVVSNPHRGGVSCPLTNSDTGPQMRSMEALVGLAGRFGRHGPTRTAP